MDRQTIYFGQLAQETDQLKQSQNAMVSLAKLGAAVLGATTIVNGFGVIPTTPASLSVNVTPGEIYQLENLEQSIWSSLPADTHTILKQGILLDAATLGITPPATVGWSQVFLVEVQYQDIDTGSLVLPYYNALNPALPFSGPGNAGTAQNTVRKGIAALQIKAGTAAPTGTQTTPSADGGWTGIFAVTVANGATTITAGNIVQIPTAPFIPVTLPNVPAGVQSAKWIYAPDTGTANHVVLSLAPAVTTLIAGQFIETKVAAANTGATDVNVNGLGAITLVHKDGSALTAGELTAGGMIGMSYDGTRFQLAWSASASAAAGVGIIDTAVSFVCYGGGANFTGFDTAFEFLSKFDITPNGSVALNCQAGTFTNAHTSTVVLNHPNADRITINGNGLFQSPPFTPGSASSGGFGSASASGLLAAWRSIYKTEINFGGGVGAGFLILAKNLTINNLLITGDGSAHSAPAPLNDSNGIMVYGGSIFTTCVACHGFGHVGIGVQSGGQITNQTNSCISGTGCGGNGIVTDSTSSLICGQSGSLILACANTGTGVLAQNESIIRTNGTGGGGIYAFSNSVGGITAANNSFISMGLSGSAQATSPALNTVGNANSFVTNTQ